MKNMKHIGFIITKISDGGAERVTTVLANKFVENGYKVTLITFENCESEYYIDPRINRVTIDSEGNSLLKIVKGSVYLHKVMKKTNCDVYVAIDVFANLISCINKLFTKVNIIISERNAPGEVELSPYTKLLRKLFYYKSDYFVFQTKFAMNYYSKSIQKRSFIIPNPIKDNLPNKNKVDSKNIVALGRLVPQKNYPLLLEAFADFLKYYPEYTLSIYGKGIMEQELIELAISLDIEDKVMFKGYYENVHNEIINSEFYIMTSNYEGMPNALMEAMAMGFPVISTDCPSGGPRELIMDGKNGFLIETANKEQLVDKMKLLASDEKIRLRFSIEALKVRNKYNSEKIFKMWEDCINQFNLN